MSQQFACCIYLPKDQSVKQLSTRPECLPKDHSIKRLSAKARVPTEGPERQEVINEGQSAYRRTRASRSYQQRPECLPKDVIDKRLSTPARASKPSGQSPEQQNKRRNGNHTRIGRSYTMAVPMNISSHREVGDPTVEIDKQQREGRTRPLIRTTKKCKRQTTRQHTTRQLRHLMHDKH